MTTLMVIRAGLSGQSILVACRNRAVGRDQIPELCRRAALPEVFQRLAENVFDYPDGFLGTRDKKSAR